MSPRPKLSDMDERTFQKRIVKIAHTHGWKVAYFHRLPTAGKQWRTPVGADGAGWPDLVLVRDRVVFAELKSDRNYNISEEQRHWIDTLAGAKAEVYVWRPRDLDDIEHILGDSPREQRLVRASGGDQEQADAVQRMIDA